MDYTIKINNVEVTAYNFSAVSTIDKTLDYAYLELRNSKTTPYRIGDYVDITVDGKTYNYIIEADQKTKLNYNKYIHRLNLIELTKKLESYTDTRRKVTQPLNALPYEMNSLWDVIVDLRNTVPLGFTDDYGSTRLFSMDIGMFDYLNGIVAPEFEWENRNLREMLNDVFEIAYGIPRLTIVDGNFVLTGDFFNNIGILRVEDSFAESENIQVNNYATELDFEINNKRVDDIKEPSATGVQNLYSPSALMATDVTVMKTSYPILELKALYVKLPYLTQNTLIDFLNYKELDVSPRTFESEDFNLLSTEPTSGLTYDEYYKANSLEWTRYQKNIGNLFEEFGFWLFDKPRLYHVLLDEITHVVAEQLGTTLDDAYDNYVTADANLTALLNDYTDVAKVQFRIQYDALVTSRSTISKNDVSTLQRPYTNIAGQGDKVVSEKRALKKMFGMVQQLSNEQVQTSSRDTGYELGDYTSDGYILITKEVFYTPNSQTAKYLWSKNYQQISEYIGLNAEIRLFDIPLQSVKRNILHKEYIEVSQSEYPNTSLLTTIAMTNFMNTFRNDPYDLNPIAGVSFKNPNRSDVATHRIYKPVIASGGESVIDIYFEFDNPKSAGEQVVEGTFRDFMDFVTYTDDDGTLDSYSVSYINSVTITNPQELPLVPIADMNAITNTYEREYKVIKNAGEILAHTYSLQVVPRINESNIFVIGTYITRYNNLFTPNDLVTDKFEIVELNKYINWAETELLNEDNVTQVSSATYSISGYQVSISANINALAFAIRNVDTKELVLGVNQKDGYVRNIYFNGASERSGMINETGEPIYGLNLPSTPTLNDVIFISSTSVRINWNDVDGETGYEVGISVGGLTWYDVTVSEDVTFKQFNVAPATDYQVRLRAFNSLGYTDYATQSFTSIAGEPLAPEQFDITLENNIVANLTWTEALGATGYTIIRNGATQGTVLAGETLEFSQTLPVDDTTYNYVLRAYNAYGYVDTSDSIYVPVYPAYEAVTISNLSSPTAITIVMDWNDPNTDTDGYKIWINDYLLDEIDNIYSSYEFTVDENGSTLVEGVSYKVGIQGYRYNYMTEAEENSYLQEQLFECGFVPSDAPSDLYTMDRTQTSITIGWTTNSTDHDSIRVQYSLDGGTWLTIANLLSSAVSYNMTTDADGLPLESDTTYYFKVGAVKSGIVNYSEIYSENTLGLLPEAPTMVSAIYDEDYNGMGEYFVVTFYDNSSDEDGFKVYVNDTLHDTLGSWYGGNYTDAFPVESEWGYGNFDIGVSVYNVNGETDYNLCSAVINRPAPPAQLSTPYMFHQQTVETDAKRVYFSFYNNDYYDDVYMEVYAVTDLPSSGYLYYSSGTSIKFATTIGGATSVNPGTSTTDGTESSWSIVELPLGTTITSIQVRAIDPSGVRPASDWFTLSNI